MAKIHALTALTMLALLLAGTSGGAGQPSGATFPVRTLGFGQVSAIAFSGDGALLAVAGATATIHLVEVSTWRVVRTLEGHRYQSVVEDMAFSPDGETLASASSDGTVKLWSVVTGEAIQTLRGHPSGVTSVSFSPDGRLLASASSNGSLRVWNLATGETLHTLEGASCWTPEGWGSASVAWSRDGKLLAWAYDRCIALLDPLTAKELGCLSGHGTWVHCLSWSPDGSQLASVDEGRMVKVWDVQTLREVRGYAVPGRVVSWSPDGRTVAAATERSEIALLSADNGGVLKTLAGHRGTMTALAWSPDGTILVSGSDDMTVRVWDTTSGEERHTLAGHACPVYSVAWSPDGRTLASGDESGTVRFWNLLTGTEERSLAAGEGLVLPLAWSPDGGLLAVGRPREDTVALWDAATGEIVRILEGYAAWGWEFAAAWSPDGEALAYSGQVGGPCPVRLWNLKVDETRDLPCCGPATWSPDGTKLACASGERSVVVVDALTGDELARIVDVGGYLHSLAWSPDGTVLAAGWGHTAITLFDTETGEAIRTLWPGSWQVYFMAYSPNGRILATLSAYDFSLRLWDPHTGTLLSTPALWTPLISWSPEGEFLAAASLDGVVKILKVSELLSR